MVASRSLVPSYIANPLSKQHPIYNLSIVLERGEKRRKKTVQEKRDIGQKLQLEKY